MITLRDYQSCAVEEIRKAMKAGKKRIIYFAPCGSGKTATSSDIISKVHAKGKKVLFLANRRELIFQAKTTLEKFGIDCGIIMAGEEKKLSAQVQIASMQTYVKRMDLDDLEFNKWWHQADLIICDECQTSISPSWQKILKAYGDMFVIGLSGSPARADGRGLGEYYDEIISTIGTKELIDQGFLVPPRYFAPSTPDLSGIPMVMNDYSKRVLGERVNKPKLIGDIYHNWASICPDRSTIIFATNVKHSIKIEEIFNSNGVMARHVDAHTPHEVRAKVFDDFQAGELQVIVNVGIACEGTDLPIASCIVLARPTKSLGRYIQMGGRGSRPFSGKRDCIILDHAGCLAEHGPLEIERHWSLDGKEIAWKKAELKEKEKQPRKCPACHRVLFDGEESCPDCGSPVKQFGRNIEVGEGTLKEVGKKEATAVEKRRFWGMLLGYQIARKEAGKNCADGFLGHKFKAKFGVWPRDMNDVLPILPDRAFLNWITYQNIKFAKSKHKEKGK